MYERLYKPTADGKTIHPPLFMTPKEIANTTRLADALPDAWSDLYETVHHGAPLPDQSASDKEQALKEKLIGAHTGTHGGMGHPIADAIEHEGFDWSREGINVAHSIDRKAVEPLVVDGHHRLAYTLNKRPNDFVPVSHSRPIYGL